MKVVVEVADRKVHCTEMTREGLRTTVEGNEMDGCLELHINQQSVLLVS